MNTNILFCGDTHGQLQHVVDAALQLRPMAVVLLGDIESPRPLHVELAPIRDLVWWIHGNHDTDKPESWHNLYQSALADRCIDGKVVVLPDGTRLAGLGGVFRKSWYPPVAALHSSYDAWLASLPRGRQGREQLFLTQQLTQRSTIFHETYLRLALQPADIFVSHEAGAAHPHGFDAIDELAAAMGARTTFHGHHHDCLDYRASWPSLGFRCFGVGLRGISDRDGKVVVPGERDTQRAARRQGLGDPS
jgi:predicted phosphodiesterase